MLKLGKKLRLSKTAFVSTIATVLILITFNSASAYYLWEVAGVTFVHTQPFYSSVTSSGQQDGGVAFNSNTNHRELWGEGSSLQWNDFAVGNQRTESGRGNYTAVVIHLQHTNSSDFNYDYNYIWSGSDVAGAQIEQLYSNEEVRYWISNPYDAIPNHSYYMMAGWYDISYPTNYGSAAQMIFSNYYEYGHYTNMIPNYGFKDDNGKVCYGSASAYPTSNSTQPYYGSC